MTYDEATVINKCGVEVSGHFEHAEYPGSKFQKVQSVCTPTLLLLAILFLNLILWNL